MLKKGGFLSLWNTPESSIIYCTHALGHGLLPGGIHRLDGLHLLARESITLHSDKGGSPGQHGDNAEHHDHRHLDAAGVGRAIVRQLVQTRADQENKRHQRLGQGGHQLVHQGEQGAHDARYLSQTKQWAKNEDVTWINQQLHTF